MTSSKEESSYAKCAQDSTSTQSSAVGKRQAEAVIGRATSRCPIRSTATTQRKWHPTIAEPRKLQRTHSQNWLMSLEQTLLDAPICNQSFIISEDTMDPRVDMNVNFLLAAIEYLQGRLDDIQDPNSPQSVSAFTIETIQRLHQERMKDQEHVLVLKAENAELQKQCEALALALEQKTREHEDMRHTLHKIEDALNQEHKRVRALHMQLAECSRAELFDSRTSLALCHKLKQDNKHLHFLSLQFA